MSLRCYESFADWSVGVARQGKIVSITFRARTTTAQMHSRVSRI